MSAPQFAVKVVAERVGPHEENPLWNIHFTVALGGGKPFLKFSVYEPTLVPLEDWTALAEGKKIGLDLYQGNGEGSISCDGETLWFMAQPSGAGGDVAAEFWLPHAQVGSQLMDALNEMGANKAWDQS